MKSLRFVTLSAALLGTTAVAQAQTTAPVPAPTIITSVPYTITKAGYYQLGADLPTTLTSGNIITVNANNVTLDFGGHYISGLSGSSMTSQLIGVSAAGKNNITVLNGTISNCYQGIVFSANSTDGTTNINQTVSNMLINFPFRTGVYFANTSSGRVTDSRITNVGGSQVQDEMVNTGIQVNGGSGIEIINNTIKSANVSVYVPQAGPTVIALRNRLIDFGPYGLYNVTKYQDNITAGVGTTAFFGGTNAGGNN